LAETEDEMKMDNTKETLLTNFINDVGRIVTNSDICFYNLGGIRSTWYKGPINEIDLFRMLPFNNTWVRFEMTGEEILKTIQTFDYYNIAPSSGMLQMFKIKNERNILKNILIFDGFEEKPLELHKTYKICTNDFLANGGSRMEYVRKWYKELRNKKDFGIIRELVKKFLLKMKGHIRKDKFVDENYPRINTE
jgi:2',3'-cyclic-nucleotide 2'-phosphodiesterase (5'-nucleotidase family)